MDNRRQHTRLDVALVAEIEVTNDTLSGETRDVSEGGAAVILSEALPEGSTVELALILTQDGIADPDEEPFQTQATVIWAAPTEDGQAMMGLRYVGVAPAEARRLKRFLAALLA
jgi:c-di-GMP-binding flagellar brake protein YcgR